MPKFTEHQSNKFTKLLLLGDSGSGKTGSTVSLIKAGYKIAVIDFDNGLDIYNKLLTPAEKERVYFKTCTDKWKAVNGRPMVIGQPKAWTTAMNMLTNWKEEGVDLGPPCDFGPEWIVMMDSMSLGGLAAFRHVCAMNSRLGPQGSSSGPRQQDWGEAMGLLEDTLGLLYSDQFQTNVIVTAHVTVEESEDDSGMKRGLPLALGTKLPPKVPRYFNTVVQAKTVGSGAGAKQYLFTKSQGIVELKNSAPGVLPDRLPLESGMATIFKTLQG